MSFLAKLNSGDKSLITWFFTKCNLLTAIVRCKFDSLTFKTESKNEKNVQKRENEFFALV